MAKAEVEKKNTGAGEAIGFTVIVIGILLLINFLAQTLNFGRVDLTEANKFSLASTSRQLVAKLDEKMEVTAYFTPDLPKPYDDTEGYVRDLLDEYEAASNGNLSVRMIQVPRDDDDAIQKAVDAGIPAAKHYKIERGNRQEVEGFRGLVLRYQGEKKTIPVIEDTAGFEYTLTSLMKEVASEKTKVGVAKGLGGPELADGLSNFESILPGNYELLDVDLESIPEDIKALLVVGPQKKLSEKQLRGINRFVLSGGSLGIFGGTKIVTIPNERAQQPGQPPEPPKSTLMDSGVNALLEKWGVKMRSDLVIDFHCGQVPAGRRILPYPPFIRISHADAQQEHPVTYKIRQSLMPFSSSVEVLDTPNGVKVESLMTTSEQSYSIRDDQFSCAIREPREWAQEVTQYVGPFDLAVAIEGKVPNAMMVNTSGQDSSDAELPDTAEEPSRILVSGSAIGLTNMLIPQRQELNSQNAQLLAFVLNAIDWLSADADLIAIRAKNIEDPTLDVPAAVSEMEEKEQAIQETLNQELQDVNSQQEAQSKVDEAVAKVEAVREKAKEATEDWDRKTMMMAAANVIGIPLVIAIFGVWRWKSRSSRKRG